MAKILIVEDEPGIYTFLQEGLTDEGYDTLVATDGYDALRDFEEWTPTWYSSIGCSPQWTVLRWAGASVRSTR